MKTFKRFDWVEPVDPAGDVIRVDGQFYRVPLRSFEIAR